MKIAPLHMLYEHNNSLLLRIGPLLILKDLIAHPYCEPSIKLVTMINHRELVAIECKLTHALVHDHAQTDSLYVGVFSALR